MLYLLQWKHAALRGSFNLPKNYPRIYVHFSSPGRHPGTWKRRHSLPTTGGATFALEGKGAMAKEWLDRRGSNLGRPCWRRGLVVWRTGRPASVVRTVETVLADWVGHDRRCLTFRLTQMLTGHGYFGRYLLKIAGREPTAQCHHCADHDEDDTADHRLARCSGFDEKHAALVVSCAVWL